MVLNYIWIGLILIAVLMGIVQMVFFGQVDIFDAILQSTFSSAKTGFEISLGLTGVLSLWMGIMKIGEKGGVINKMSHVVSPFFSKLFPEVPKDHPAIGSMFMNLSATMIGIDNAATPMGLKAMKELQELNPDKTKASNAMIMFLVLVTSGLTLVPVSIMVYRAQMGAANPADVFLPILIATFCAAMAGIISVAIAQKINLLKPVFIGTILGICAFVGLIIWAAMVIPKETFNTWSTAVSAMILLGLICWFIIQAMVAKINVYVPSESFHTSSPSLWL